MFGKVMTVNDDLIIKYFTLVTRVNLDTVKEYEEELRNGVNPRDVKLKLAHEIVSMYHSKDIADKAQEEWKRTFSNKEIPEDIQEYEASGASLVDFLVNNNFVDSKAKARRLIEDGAVRNLDTDTKIEDVSYTISSGLKLKIGKKSFAKII